MTPEQRIIRAARKALVMLGTPPFYDVRQDWARELHAAIADYDAGAKPKGDPSNPFQYRPRSGGTP